MRTLQISFALFFLVAGCTNPAVPATCSPACTGDTTCDATTSTCVPNSVAINDMAAVSPDLLGDCVPACSAGTHCNAHQQCVQCLTDAECAIGTYCLTGSCVPGCDSDGGCPTSDAGNGESCCGMACVDTDRDTNNCGACGMVCSSNHATSNCASGVCAIGACNPGYGNCNMNPADGCEANLHVDVNNCASCGAACMMANAIAGCSDGCYIAACDFGYDDCDGMVANGCETPVLSDPKNCGSCGSPCMNPPNGQDSCQNAACVLTGCNAGFFDCNGIAKDGCEVNIATDANNCGACGNVCPNGLVCKNDSCTCPNCNFPNAKSACVNNVCQLLSCLPGYADCNGVAADGCEVNTNNDKNNCSACGMVCPMNLPGCNMGVCAMGCLDGMQPPLACVNGADPQTNATYTICTADCNTAWLAGTNGGGKYHILEICKSYGYSNYGKYGGTCGDVCGYCGQNSCMNVMANNTWDMGGMNCGNDANGPILCQTVQWQCLK